MIEIQTEVPVVSIKYIKTVLTLFQHDNPVIHFCHHLLFSKSLSILWLPLLYLTCNFTIYSQFSPVKLRKRASVIRKDKGRLRKLFVKKMKGSRKGIQ